MADDSNKIWEPVAQGLQALGDATVSGISKAAQMAGAGLGMLLSAVGLGGVGEAVTAASAKGAENDGERAAAPTTPVKVQKPEIEAPSVEKERVIVLPAAAYAAVQAIKENPISMEVSSPREIDVLGSLARAATPAVSLPQQDRGVGIG